MKPFSVINQYYQCKMLLLTQFFRFVALSFNFSCKVLPIPFSKFLAISFVFSYCSGETNGSIDLRYLKK